MKRVNPCGPRAGEYGAISIKSLLIFAILASALFVIIKVAPVYIDERQVIYKVDDLANKSAVRNSKEEDIKRGIDAIRKEYNLPENSINLVSREMGKVQISISYTVPINLLITTYAWHVEDNRIGKATL